MTILTMQYPIFFYRNGINKDLSIRYTTFYKKQTFQTIEDLL